MASGFMRSRTKSVPTFYEGPIITLRVNLSDIKIYKYREVYLSAISPKTVLSIYRATRIIPLQSFIGSIIVNVSFPKSC